MGCTKQINKMEFPKPTEEKENGSVGKHDTENL